MSDPSPKPSVPRSWLVRNLTNLVILGCVLLIGLMQWPALKAVAHHAFSSSSSAADNIAWRKDYNRAVAESHTSGKTLLLDFTASWCPPCQMMKHDVWPDKQVEAIANAQFIPVAVDVDSEPAATAQFQVSSIPTVVTISSSGDVQRRTGFMSAADLVDFLTRSLPPAPQASAALPQ